MPDENSKVKQSLYHVLSIDVVLGSLAVGTFAIHLLQVRPPFAWYLVLAGAVWVVYTLDHLLDGLKGKGSSHIYRHAFHYQNRRKISWMLTILAVITLVLTAVFLEKEILIWGTYLSLFVAGYLALHYLSIKNQGVYFQKELIIAAVYIAGIFIAPLFWYGQQPTNDILVVIAALFLLAWAEGLIMSYYEYDADRMAGFVSFTTVYGQKGTRAFLITLLVCLLAFLVVGIFAFTDSLIRTALVIEAVMATILLVLIGFTGIFGKQEFFRLAGESVFLLPACILLV